MHHAITSGATAAAKSANGSRSIRRRVPSFFEFGLPVPPWMSYTLAKKVMQSTQTPSDKNNSIGCILLGIFPILLVGIRFLAWSIEEDGNRAASWLWIPFSAFLMIGFAVIHYYASIKNSERYSDVGLARSVGKYIARQVLVLIAFAVIIWLLGKLNPFGGVHY